MTQLYTVIGHPLKHTMSPFIHRRLFDISGIDVRYDVSDIPPENLKDSLSYLRGLDGFNITIPHKESLISLLDGTDRTAAKYGAVNCVKCKNGKLYGTNTDACGFFEALKYGGISIPESVLVLGCGGAAKTVARAAAESGSSVTVAVRKQSLDKASVFAASVNASGGRTYITDIADIHGKYGLLINATPVGMYPDVNKSPVGMSVAENCDALFEAIYNPADTLLLKAMKNLGKPTVSGMPMLVFQAAKAHEFWYGGSFRENDIKALIADAEAETVRIFYEK